MPKSGPRLAAAGLGLTLLGWTAYWVLQAIPMVRANTRIGSGTWGPALEGHEVFELVFVASHCLVRWAPGALVLLTALFMLRRLDRRLRA